jgi:hypothetical protein
MKKIFILTFLLLALSVGIINGQDLSQLKTSDPVKISGSVGTQNTFFMSSNNLGYRSPFSNNLFMNLNMSFYGFDVPLAFYYANNNSGFTHPFVQFGMSPRYKSLQLHLGYRSMNFSSYTYSGLNFLGAGLEYNWKIIRIGVFAGTLNQAINDDPMLPSPRMPLYKRNAFGAKVGIGNSSNYVDLIVFKAKDDTISVLPTWRHQLVGLENLVVGTSARISVGKFLVLSSDIAGSVFTNDMSALELMSPELEPLMNYFTPRLSTTFRYAGDIKASLRLGTLNLMATYRHIQPDFYSLGTSFFNHNLQSLGLNLNTLFFSNRVVVSLSAHAQEDNVSKRQLYTNRAMVYTANATARLTQIFNLTGTYNGFNQNQTDGRAVINDSVRIDRLMHNFTLSPSINLMKGTLAHSYSGNLNLSMNKNQNPVVQDPGDINTLAAGLGYNLSMTERKLNLMANWNLQNSTSDFHTFSSNIFGIGAVKRLLPDGTLNISINSNLALSNVNDDMKGVSVMTSAGASYTYNQKHSANFRFNLNSINNHNREGLYSVSGTDMTIGVGYTYTFAPLQMRSAASSVRP